MLTEQTDEHDTWSIHYNFKGSTWKEYKVECLLEPKEMDSEAMWSYGAEGREGSEYLLFYSNRLSPQ